MILLLLIIALYRGAFFSVNKQKKFSQDSLFDRAWWNSLFLLICLHGTDMPLFDSRINLAGWILLAGLRSFIRVPNTTQKFSRVFQ